MHRLATEDLILAGSKVWDNNPSQDDKTYSLVLFCNPDSFLVIVQCLVVLEISLRCLHKKGRLGKKREIGEGMGGWNRKLSISVKHL